MFSTSPLTLGLSVLIHSNDSMIRPYSQVLVAVLILCIHSVYTQCVDKQPPNCKVIGVPVENYDEEQVFEQLEISVISATTNRTVYAGQTAVFHRIAL